MPETFSVDVCHNLPCHFTPRPSLAQGLDGVTNPASHPRLDLPDINANQPIPGSYGDHPVHQNQKRQAVPPDQSSRQGPPLPEWPDAHEIVEPVEFTRSNVNHDIDPEVEQIAVDRQEATKAAQKKISPRPPSFLDHMDTRYILRPEAIESVFYMWRITGDPSWQEKGWHMWESIERTSWTDLAYSAIADVNDVNSIQADSMERHI